MLVQGDPELSLSNRYQYWGLTRDESITDRADDHWAGVKFVSPILKFDQNQTWRTDVTSMFSPIGIKWTFRPNESCGTHVHISPRNGWDMRSLGASAKAIIFFEDAIFGILPHYRAASVYCKQNYLAIGGFTRKTEAWSENACRDIDELKRLMNPTRKKYLLIGPHSLPYSRYFAWNYTTVDSIHTVEFRAPPEVDNAEDCRSWVEFAINFVNAAIQAGSSGPSETDYGEEVRGLYEFLKSGYMNGYSELGSWRRLLCKGMAPSSSGEIGGVERANGINVVPT
ncbi:hypothetical protein VM1G_11812 [Cytospora mali]|uniref:Uncharacterized protein n=1 Tax=Cytospora mali TaxID=578113 RepID=A0A194W7G2_CYTMA|nr:hypothetical protein VM1G_11812 [Valsa mali]